MNKLISAISLTVVAFTLAACSSTGKRGEELACFYPDALSVQAPGWVCEQPVDGVQVSAVGSYRATKAGVQFQKNQAVAAARNQLAANMRIHVRQLIKNYTAVTGMGEAETVDAVSSDVSKQITKETLYGSKLYQYVVNPETGTMYAVVGVDPANTLRNAQTALQTSYKNNQAMWQRFLADKEHNSLDEEIRKISRGY